MPMRRLVEAIPGTPLPNGILNSGCIPLIDAADPHEMLGVEWLQGACCSACAWDDPCLTGESPGEPPESPAAGVKQFCPPVREDADPVTIYYGYECNPIGQSRAEAAAMAREGLLLGRQHALEAWVWQRVLMPVAEDLTPPEGAVSLAAGLAAVEGCMAARYGGQGVVHVPAGAAALLGCCQLAIREGDSGLRSLLGNCFVLGSGYGVNTGPDGAPAPAGEAWLVASGPMVIRQSPPQVLPDGSMQEVIDIQTNERMVLAEQTYVPQLSCGACAIRVNASGCC